MGESKFLREATMEFFNFFKSDKKDSNLIDIKVDDTHQQIHQETIHIFDSIFVRPTVKHPHIGICNTCNKNKKQFMYKLMDFDNPESCFLKGHDVESIAGKQEHLTNTDEYFEETEKAADLTGDLPW